MSDHSHLNLTKNTLPELKELLERQNALLRNRKLLEQLKDKGESARQLREKIEKEITVRSNLEKVEKSLGELTITDTEKQSSSKEQHVVYVCSREKPSDNTRYRPHRTLMHTKQDSSTKKSPKKFVEVTSAYEPYLIHQPTQCIPLSQSLIIQQEQARKVTEEQTKRFLQGFQDYNDSSGSDGEDTITLEDKS
ncbi:hypothetical protein FQR65_LT11597 [Abscondita terminalis]|nr:hypothetical protein FQR65_LT11597 [Abscondita terminalis]